MSSCKFIVGFKKELKTTNGIVHYFSVKVYFYDSIVATISVYLHWTVE